MKNIDVQVVSLMVQELWKPGEEMERLYLKQVVSVICRLRKIAEHNQLVQLVFLAFEILRNISQNNL